MDTLIAIANPSATDAVVALSVQFDDGSTEHRTLSVPPAAHVNLEHRGRVPGFAGPVHRRGRERGTAGGGPVC